MKKLPTSILNGIVATICAIAIIGYFLFPLWSIKVNVSFNEDVAELLLDNVGEDSGDESSNENNMVPMLIEELAEENITLKFAVSIDTGLLCSCALSSDKTKVENFIFDLIDDLVGAIDKKTLQEIEDSIAKATVTTAVKMELQELSKELGEDVEKIMNDIGLDEEYLDEKTTTLLNAVRDENASVDSVTDVVMDVVDDVYTKYGNAYPDDYEPLAPEDEEELRAEISDIISELADEDGNIDGDGLLSALISGLLSEEDSEELEEDFVPEYSPVSHSGIVFTVDKYLAPKDNSNQNKDIDEIIADTIKSNITDESLDVIRIIAIAIFAFVFLSAFWWIYLIIKILAKIGMRNPLISVKAPIISGCIPFIVFVLIPSIAIGSLANPSGALANMLGKDGVEIMQKLFGGAINVSFTSSSIVSCVCALVLFVFGFFYSARRREIKRQIKQQKRAQQQSGGLY